MKRRTGSGVKPGAPGAPPCRQPPQRIGCLVHPGSACLRLLPWGAVGLLLVSGACRPLRAQAPEGAPERAAPEGAASNPLARRAWVRALADSGLQDSAIVVARGWVAMEPRRLTAYAELAALLAGAGRPEEAVHVLREARRVVDDRGLFAQELAVHLVRLGAYREAAAEWLIILGWAEPGVRIVEAHLRDPTVDRLRAVTALRGALSTKPAGLVVRRAALRLSLNLEERAWSREIVAALIAAAPPETGLDVLREYAIEVRNLGHTDSAAWAAGLLAREAHTEGERWHWAAVNADLTLEGGDREAARRLFDDVLREADPGSEPHRLALHRLFVLGLDDDVDGATALLDDYRAAYPEDGDQAARMAAKIVERRLADGDLEAARAALEHPPIPSPATAAEMHLEMQKGWLALYGGRPATALGHFELAAAGGDARDVAVRSEAIALASVLSRADSAPAAQLGKAGALLLRGDGPEAVVLTVGSWDRPDPATPGLMELASRLLERAGYREEAATVRVSIVDHFPDAAERPAALLSLARAEVGRDAAAARQWLERLIVEHPDSALAPVARRLLAELDGMVPRG